MKFDIKGSRNQHRSLRGLSLRGALLKTGSLELLMSALMVTLSLVPQMGFAESFTVYDNRDITAGKDLGKFSVRSKRDCMEKCIGYANCKAFVWVTARGGVPVAECFLKDSKTMGRPPTGVSCSAHIRH